MKLASALWAPERAGALRPPLRSTLMRVDEEVEATLDTMPMGGTPTGFCSFGEISPSGLSLCDLHNQTMTLTTECERHA